MKNEKCHGKLRKGVVLYNIHYIRQTKLLVTTNTERILG